MRIYAYYVIVYMKISYSYHSEQHWEVGEPTFKKRYSHTQQIKNEYSIPFDYSFSLCALVA